MIKSIADIRGMITGARSRSRKLAPQLILLLGLLDKVTAFNVFGEVEFRILRSDGSLLWIEHACQSVYNEEGLFLGTRGSNRDITGRKQSESLMRIQRDLGLALSETKSLAEGLRISLMTALGVSGMDCGGIYLIDETTESFNLLFH